MYQVYSLQYILRNIIYSTGNEYCILMFCGMVNPKEGGDQKGSIFLMFLF